MIVRYDKLMFNDKPDRRSKCVITVSDRNALFRSPGIPEVTILSCGPEYQSWVSLSVGFLALLGGDNGYVMTQTWNHLSVSTRPRSVRLKPALLLCPSLHTV